MRHLHPSQTALFAARAKEAHAAVPSSATTLATTFILILVIFFAASITLVQNLFDFENGMIYARLELQGFSLQVTIGTKAIGPEVWLR